MKKDEKEFKENSKRKKKKGNECKVEYGKIIT